MCDISFTEEDIIEAINSFSLNSAAGPDGVPAIVLKKCANSISLPLKLFWNNCLELGVTPLELKTSYITPIFKGGDQGEPSNYRPVPLTSHLTKTFEKIVRKKIVQHMDNNNLFNESQHGFRSGLLTHFDTILSHLENGKNIDTIYLDFSKAFDKVDHNILIAKLRRYKINEKVIHWIKSFITGRIQFVTVNNILSEFSKIISGVPQGSVLGPLLFLIMISDIDDNVSYSILSSFADDTRVLKETTELLDSFKLQHDLNQIYKWTQRNNMKLNGCKFEHLCYGRNNDVKCFSVYLNNEHSKIETKNSVKDLGVIMTNDGKFDDHINVVVSKVNNLVSWILRTFEARDEKTMLTLWKSLVIPHLDYCSQLWSPTK